ncbi:MAG: (d)CMP kinase [Deltaproteobacteria bacterium]|nr:(d)CMP kinase [Deltaproteobacteria bacterium]
MHPMIVTIDGPAGAGKTTVSRILARRLGYRYVDTGALYRGIAFAATNAGIDPADDKGLEKMLAGMKIGFTVREGSTRLMLNEKDITDRIRTPRIAMAASAVSARPVVRKFLLDIQRELGKEKKAVFEGRDMGTVVFPQADVKFYLDASVQMRAARRFREFEGESGQSMEAVENDIRRRDENDSNRSLAPLRKADDAIAIDSTDMTIDRVVEAMYRHVSKLSGGD